MHSPGNTCITHAPFFGINGNTYFRMVLEAVLVTQLSPVELYHKCVAADTSFC